jgi:sulfate/thiosulfate transport system ATP-binding protein
MWLLHLHEQRPVTTLLVTHDQEEAMEVADHLAVIREGRLEQWGTPAELYENPSNEFVLTFIGPATRLGGRWVRPHDLVLHRYAEAGAKSARVERVTKLGFEVRVELVLEDGQDFWVQMTRGAASELDLKSGDQVWVAEPDEHRDTLAQQLSTISI